MKKGGNRVFSVVILFQQSFRHTQYRFRCAAGRGTGWNAGLVCVVLACVTAPVLLRIPEDTGTVKQGLCLAESWQNIDFYGKYSYNYKHKIEGVYPR